MRWGRPLVVVPGLLAAVLISGCGGGAAAGGNDPVGVAQAYIDAAKGNPTAAQQYLETESTEKLTGETSLTRFLAANKSATLKIATISWTPPDGTAALPSKSECLIGQPAPAQICIVTVAADGGKAGPVWFHVVLEKRYTPTWLIINVDMVEKAPDNLLPSGNQAHKA